MDYQGIRFQDSFHIEELFSLHYFEYMSTFSFPGESHDFWEFVCVDKGEVTIGAGDRTLTLKRGEIAFHSPNEFHWVKANGRTAPNLIVISFSCTSPAMDFFAGKILNVQDTERLLLAKIIMEADTFLKGRLDNPYQKVLTLGDSFPPFAGQLIRMYLEELLISLYRRFHSADSLADRHVQYRICGGLQQSARPFEQMIGAPAGSVSRNTPENMSTENADAELFSQLTDYLTRNLAGHITIEKICRDNLIGRSRLQRLFQEKSGCGIIEYFSGLKIREAKSLIRTEQMNFSQIAEKLGYSSVHYFSRQFKKLTGMTPSEYASSIRALADKDTMSS